MGNLIGVLSTVILVSTVCTLIFAVGAYVISRKGRKGVGVQVEAVPAPGEDVADRLPDPTVSVPAASLFKRAPSGGSGATATTVAESQTDEDYQWK
ncbi:MAG TPA: hypothetical protein DCS43_17055 [Verrucomicrobia bacterium]|nr:hypothetical protein [Verrucomicrobiota bacterium]